MEFLIYFILICVCLLFIHKFLSRFKFPKINCLAVFTGDVKVGKSGVSLACTISNYKRIHRGWAVRQFFRKLFHIKKVEEEPLFYSNIPIAGIKYCELTLDHILRKKRFNFKSISFVDEASLLADCYISKSNPELSVSLLKFFKLYGHETHGGYCVFNSQAISDLHIALRKCTSQYFYIHDTSPKWFPFISYCHMREERYTEDGSTMNVYHSDVEDSMKLCLFRKRVFKMYDYCAYSILTDNLPTDNVEKYNKIGSNLKATKLVSFRKEFVDMFNNEIFKDGVLDEKKDN